MSADFALAVKEAIRAQALALGFHGVGFAPVDGDRRWAENLNGFLREGRQGEMAWLADTADRRPCPAAIWPAARTTIVLATSYAPSGDAEAAVRDPARAAVCAHGRTRDYHDVLKKRLKVLGRWIAACHGGETRPYVDTAPLMEKPLAQRAGLGWQGRHTLVISRRLGGWLLLGEMLTDLDLPPDPPEDNHCGTCRACVDACPTGALEDDFRIDPRRCLSYHTIEARAAMPEEMRPALGNRVYGCDACQAACPWTRRALPADPALAERPELAALRLADLVDLDEAGFRALFSGTPVRRVGRDRFVATVLIAIANGRQLELLPRIDRLCHDPAPLVRDMAQWARLRLDGEGAGQL